MLWLPIVLAIVVLIAIYGWYMTLIQRRNKAREALSSIDVQLRKRHDLLPNVLKLAQKFMTHEKQLLTELTALRAQVTQSYDRSDPEQVAQHLEAARSLEAGMSRLFAVAENYPELRSSETIVTAQHTYTEVEGHIAAARRFYNSAVGSLNNAVEIFPGSVIANLAGVKTMPFYEIEDTEIREPVNVDDHLA